MRPRTGSRRSIRPKPTISKNAGTPSSPMNSISMTWATMPTMRSTCTRRWSRRRSRSSSMTCAPRQGRPWRGRRRRPFRRRPRRRPGGDDRRRRPTDTRLRLRRRRRRRLQPRIERGGGLVLNVGTGVDLHRAALRDDGVAGGVGAGTGPRAGSSRRPCGRARGSTRPGPSSTSAGRRGPRSKRASWPPSPLSPARWEPGVLGDDHGPRRRGGRGASARRARHRRAGGTRSP